MCICQWASQLAQLVKNPSAVQETWVWFMGWEDPMEEGMASHSSILTGKIPWTEEPGRSYGPWGHRESDTTETTEPALEILRKRSLLKQGLHLWLKWGALRQCGSTSLCRHDAGVCLGLHLQLQPPNCQWRSAGSGQYKCISTRYSRSNPGAEFPGGCTSGWLKRQRK